MSASSFSLGISPASEAAVAFTITITRIVVAPDRREPVTGTLAGPL
jgi:hypothetical protein